MKKLSTKKQKSPKANRRPKRAAATVEQVDMGLIPQLLSDYFPLKEDGLEQILEPILNAQPEEAEDMPSAESLSELGEILEQTRLDVSGGDPQARETLKSAHAMIDEAAERDAIHPAVLIVLGRLFAGAKIDIGGRRARRWSGYSTGTSSSTPGVDAYSAFRAAARIGCQGRPVRSLRGDRRPDRDLPSPLQGKLHRKPRR